MPELKKQLHTKLFVYSSEVMQKSGGTYAVNPNQPEG